jgi:hypothetical protein
VKFYKTLSNTGNYWTLSNWGTSGLPDDIALELVMERAYYGYRTRNGNLSLEMDRGFQFQRLNIGSRYKLQMVFAASKERGADVWMDDQLLWDNFNPWNRIKDMYNGTDPNYWRSHALNAVYIFTATKQRHYFWFRGKDDTIGLSSFVLFVCDPPPPLMSSPVVL